MVINKGADFKGIGNKFHIDPVTARIIRNREVIGDEEIHSFLAGTLQELPDVHLMQDLDLLVELLDQKINCLLYTSPSPRDSTSSRMPSSA